MCGLPIVKVVVNFDGENGESCTMGDWRIEKVIKMLNTKGEMI